MKTLKYGFGLILVGGFALTASCGGSSDDSSSGSSGATSSAGTSSDLAGSSSANGGAGTTTGGTGTTTGGTTTGGTGTTTGGATAGGATAGGAAAGGAAAGGAGAMNPAGCPAATAAPKTGTMCTLGMNNRPETCAYPAADAGEQMTCECAALRVGRGPGNGAAGAPDAADGTLTCATECAAHTSTPPVTGGACTGNLACDFGATARVNTDICQCRADKWTCRTVGGMGAAGAAN